MLLGKITGTVVATRKDENLIGLRFLLVEELDTSMKSNGRIVVAADSVGAGVGEVVLYASGSSARQTVVTKDRPVDATIMAIVDELEVGGQSIFRKD
jgi:microcompartment protein CcmK/EutM